MNVSKQIGLGFSTYGNAFNILFSKGLWWAFAFPLLLNLILFFTGYQFVDVLTNWLKTEVSSLTSLDHAAFFGAGALKWLMGGAIWLIFKILFFILFSYLGGFITLIILSPVLAFLSERTEKIQSGHNYSFNAEQLMRDIVRGILIALRNLFIQLGIIIGLFILSAIPVLGWIVGILSPFIIFFVTSYFYGFSFMDYNNERRKQGISESVKLMRKYKWTLIANGMVLALVIIVPMCGFGTILCPFVAIVSVVAGSLAMEKIYEAENIVRS